MEATVRDSAGDVRVEEIPDPVIAAPSDALARLLVTPRQGAPSATARPAVPVPQILRRRDTCPQSHPITTHAMSGLGTSERDYARACRGAILAEGLAVQGEKVAAAGATVDVWVRRTGLTRA